MELRPTIQIFSNTMQYIFLQDIKLKLYHILVSSNSEIIFLNDCVIRLADDVGDIKLKIISANDSAEAKPFIKMIKPHITLIRKFIITLCLYSIVTECICPKFSQNIGLCKFILYFLR